MLYRDEFTVDDGSRRLFSLDALESFIACRIRNRLSVIGGNTVQVAVATSALLRGEHIVELFRKNYDRLVSLGSVSELVRRVYDTPLRLSVTDLTAVAAPPARAHELPIASMTSLRYATGFYLSVNVGHRLTSVGIVRLTDSGFILAGLLRFSTDDLRRPAEAAERMRGALAQTTENIINGERYVGACLSIAETVIAGRMYPNLDGGLFGSIPHAAADMGWRLRDVIREFAKVDEVLLINDSCAEGIYASRLSGTYCSGMVQSFLTNVLTVRFGTWSAVSYVAANGYNIERMNEYSYVVTSPHMGDEKSHPGCIGEVLSRRGFGIVARDLGLLNKYGINATDAPMALRHMLAGQDECADDVVRVYTTIGLQIALLVDELEGDAQIHHVCVLGSIANQIDRVVVDLMELGFRQCAVERGIDTSHLAFHFIPDSSHKASIVGAALQQAEARALRG